MERLLKLIKQWFDNGWQVTVANKDWHICGGIQYNSDSGSLLPHYKNTLIPEIRVLIFNGDVDACVPYNGNEWWTSSLGQ